MQVVRNSKRNGRRPSGGNNKLAIIIAIIAGAAVLVAAAVIILIFVLLPRGGSKDTQSQTSSVVSSEQQSNESGDEQDSENGPSEETIALNGNAATAKTSGSLAYQSLHPDMYVPVVEKIPAAETDKLVYLTFDGAPSDKTAALLEQLDSNDVKATFFVTAYGETTDELKNTIKSIADKGHTIGIYSYSNDKSGIYNSVEEYLDDFARMYDIVLEVTGQRPTVFRFPGGSFCEENKDIHMELIAEMQRRGFTYYDWNVDPGDNLYNATAETIASATSNGILSNNKSIVILTNGETNGETVNAVSSIIQKGEKSGYSFKALDPSVKAFSFSEVEEE